MGASFTPAKNEGGTESFLVMLKGGKKSCGVVLAQALEVLAILK